MGCARPRRRRRPGRRPCASGPPRARHPRARATRRGRRHPPRRGSRGDHAAPRRGTAETRREDDAARPPLRADGGVGEVEGLGEDATGLVEPAGAA
ncbi:MAG: hypothetical protein MZV64_10695 [Ignavibacteriales bacterium]|nr:hypothetical protein [Ignavibacteriales bacterium]